MRALEGAWAAFKRRPHSTGGPPVCRLLPTSYCESSSPPLGRTRASDDFRAESASRSRSSEMSARGMSYAPRRDETAYVRRATRPSSASAKVAQLKVLPVPEPAVPLARRRAKRSTERGRGGSTPAAAVHGDVLYCPTSPLPHRRGHFTCCCAAAARSPGICRVGARLPPLLSLSHHPARQRHRTVALAPLHHRTTTGRGRPSNHPTAVAQRAGRTSLLHCVQVEGRSH